MRVLERMGAGQQQPVVRASFADSSMISQLYLHSKSQAKPLRIGLMIDAFQIPAVFRQVLMDIQASDFASIELVILNQETQRPFRLHSVLYEAFQKRDRLQLPNPNPLEGVDCTDLLGSCPRLDVIPIGNRSVHRFPPDAIAALQAADLDVILRFGFRNLRGGVLTSARYGVWSFHYGDNEFYRGGPALFWEVVEDNPCSGATLQVLAEKRDDGLVLCKSIFPTVRGHWPSRNSFQPHWGSSHFVIRKLHELHERGWNSVKLGAVPRASYRGKAKIYRAPSDWQMAKWLVPRWLVPKVRNAVSPRNDTETEQIDQWRICLRRANSPELMTGESRDKSNFRWMPSPQGHFYADPMLIEHEGQAWMFFEDFVYKHRRGRIACAPIQADGSIGKATVCLDLPYHLSYPVVFRHNSEIFMVPESYQNEGIELWRATNFPFSWKLEKTLFKGEFVDTTPVLHEDRWYFFTAPVERNTKPAFGALFSSDSLTGDWVHHPSSPISTDVRDARSGGAIVKVGNRLLRPVQDCAENYGRRIHVEEIVELSPTSYRARRLHSIEPDWEPGLRGVHTYAHGAGFEVLDAVRLQDRHVLGA